MKAESAAYNPFDCQMDDYAFQEMVFIATNRILTSCYYLLFEVHPWSQKNPSLGEIVLRSIGS